MSAILFRVGNFAVAKKGKILGAPWERLFWRFYHIPAAKKGITS